jgi:hypothetical protein
MSLATALNVLRPTLPYSLALTMYDLLHQDANPFEFRPHTPTPTNAQVDQLSWHSTLR